MIESEKAKFAEILYALGQYCDKDLPKGVIEIYWNGLKHLDFSAIRDAMSRHIHNPDTGQFMPKIADITRMLGGTSNDKAMVAWAKVDSAVRHVGPYRSVVFDDPLIHRVLVEMGGWISLGEKQTDEWPFIAKEFENRYRGYAMRGETPEYQPVLTGISDAYNSKEGFKTEPPMLIGNVEKAQEVMRLGVDRPMIGFTQAWSVGTNLRLVDAGE